MNSFASRAGRWPLAIILAALSAACVQPTRHASSSVARSAVGTGSSRLNVEARTSNRHTITRSELTPVWANTAYDLVLRLRPEFLRHTTRTPGAISSTGVFVYDGDLALGPVSMLQQIPASSVIEVRYVTPVEAFLRYGPKHDGGVIVVETRR